MTESNGKNDEQSVLLELFKSYLEDLGRIGGRHETLRQFYVSVISALFVFLAMAGKEGLFQAVRGGVLVIVALVGIIVCVAWILHMSSFADLFSAKTATLCKLEEKLPFQLFSTEKQELKEKGRIRLTTVDRIIAAAFILLFIALLFFKGI